MRLFRQLLSIVTLTSSLLAAGQATDITFTSKGLAAEEAYLGYHLADQKFVEDTLTVGEGGEMKIYSEEGLRPGLYFIYVPEGIYLEFVINEPSFELISTGEGYDNLEVKGSRENAAFKEFQMKLGALQKQRTELAQSLEKLTGADSAAVRDQLVALTDEANNIRDRIIEENPDLMISKMLRLMQPIPIEEFPEIADEDEKRRKVFHAYRNTYRERLDFEEFGLLRTPIFKDQVMRYLTEVIPQAPDTISAELDEILATVKDDPVAFRFWLVTFTNHYQTPKLMGQDAVLVHLLEDYYLSSQADWITEESLEKMREEVAFLKPNLIGQPAPALQLIDTAQAPVNALEIDGDYLVLFFYDPDCGHCKKKTPILRDAYYDLKDLGAEVVAVCGITDQEKWKNYIIENELDWVNLADPFYRSNFRADYNVRSFPQVYVLDGERKIVAKKLDVDQLVNFISDHREIVNP